MVITSSDITSSQLFLTKRGKMYFSEILLGKYSIIQNNYDIITRTFVYAVYDIFIEYIKR